MPRSSAAAACAAAAGDVKAADAFPRAPAVIAPPEGAWPKPVADEAAPERGMAAAGGGGRVAVRLGASLREREGRVAVRLGASLRVSRLRAAGGRGGLRKAAGGGRPVKDPPPTKSTILRNKRYFTKKA